MVKQWDSTLDGKTRSEHKVADGQIRELDKDFEVGGEKLKAPSVGGSAWNVCNCRCCVLQRARWTVKGETSYQKWDNENGGFIECTGYDDFKEKYLKVSEQMKSLEKSKNTEIVKRKFYTKKELDNMSIDELRKEVNSLAKEYYKSGKSGISFGDANTDVVADKLTSGASRSSLTKDYMSIKKRMDVDKFSNNDIIKSEPMSTYMNSSEQIYKNIKKVKPIDGYEDFAIHGDKTSFCINNADGLEIDTYTPKEFAKIIKADPNYNGGNIRLLSCEAGADGATAAQELANELGVVVKAPNDILWVDTEGNMTIGPNVTKSIGKWIDFTPRK